jgi:hypothetical protein
MRLRYFQTYDKQGRESEVTLQYWNKYAEEWMEVNLIRVREQDEYDAMNDKNLC